MNLNLEKRENNKYFMRNYYLSIFMLISIISGAQSYTQSNLLEESYDSLIDIYDANPSDTIFCQTNSKCLFN